MNNYDEKALTETFYLFKKQYQRYMSDTEGESHLQIIIRSHLYIEHELQLILQKNLKHPNLIVSDRLRFSDLVKFVFAMGIIPYENLDAFLKINKLRNLLAHDLNYELTESDINKVLDSFSKPMKKQFEAFYANNNDLTMKLKAVLFSVWDLASAIRFIPTEDLE